LTPKTITNHKKSKLKSLKNISNSFMLFKLKNTRIT